MELTPQAIRSFRLRAHHLDAPLPGAALCEAAGACGVQNSPPGAWETALFQRVAGCTLAGLHRALYQEKSLLQAWSYRGAPVVFPTAESAVFLDPLCALPGEEPWIYTRGIALGLDFLGLSLEDLLPLVRQAARWLDGHTVAGKEELDRALAALVAPYLPPDKRPLWDAPSLYGAPDRQTVGGAMVSFLLRPCAFSSLVVFGERQGVRPTFTSFQNWLGQAPRPAPDAPQRLARKFLHCYGPTGPDALAAWLGCTPRQAKRLWNAVAEEVEPVRVAGKTRYVLAADREALRAAGPEGARLLLLGPHDPYLDARDRALLLPEPHLQRLVWRTVGNPGAVLRGGRVIGLWTQKQQASRLALSLQVWEPLDAAQRQTLTDRAEAYAAYRQCALTACDLRTP